MVGFHPRRSGPDRVLAVSCKSWQTGFNANRNLAQLRRQVPNPKRRQELRFRELWIPKWAQGFRQRIAELTGQSEFTYCLAVTHVKGDTAAWAADPTIRENLAGNPMRFLPLEQMWSEVLASVTTTPAASEFGLARPAA